MNLSFFVTFCPFEPHILSVQDLISILGYCLSCEQSRCMFLCLLQSHDACNHAHLGMLIGMMSSLKVKKT